MDWFTVKMTIFLELALISIHYFRVVHQLGPSA